MNFKKKDEYRETLIGRIPKEWEVFKLKELVDVKGGKRLPKRDSLVDFETAHKYIRIVDFKNGSVDVSDVKYLLPETYRKIKKYTISSEDVYISIAGTIGLAGLIPPELDGANLTENAAKLSNLKKVMKEYLVIVLNSRILQNQINRFTGKATQPKLALFRIEKLKIPVPGEKEQQKIVEILGTMDEAIEKVDKAIEKTEQLKKGLMQELLTKGIGHKEFKDSKIGRIPKEWELKKLKDISTKITDGSHYSPKEDKEGQYLIATVANIKNNQIDIGSCKKINEKDYKKLVQNGCKPKLGEVLFSKDGTVGLTFSFSQDIDLVVLSSIAIIRPKENLDSKYCSYALRSSAVFSQIIGSKRGTGLRRIILQDLKRVKIPFPSLQEQQKIVEILSTVDKKIDLEKKRKVKLERLKKGLMQDLLTGKKRVKI